jgi:hypothetical protein
MLEQRKRDALERLREVAAALQDVLPGDIERDLRPERSGARP